MHGSNLRGVWFSGWPVSLHGGCRSPKRHYDAGDEWELSSSLVAAWSTAPAREVDASKRRVVDEVQITFTHALRMFHVGRWDKAKPRLAMQLFTRLVQPAVPAAHFADARYKNDDDEVD